MAKTYEIATSLHNFAGDFFQNVFAYQLTEAGSATAFEYADALCDAWASGPAADYMNLMGTDVILDFLSAKRIESPGGPSATKIISSVGTLPNVSVTAGVAFDVAWQTAAGSNRPGHTFITGMDGSQLAGGQWVPGYLTLVDAWITAMLPPLTLAGGLGNATFGVFSRKLSQFNVAEHGIKKPKPSMLNKRTLPVL